MKLNSDIVSKSLFKRLQNNDHKAFLKIYEQFFNSIYNTILYLVRNPDLAEELTQEFFIKLWERRKQITIHTSPVVYIQKMCRNHVYDYFKKMKQEQLAAYEDVDENVLIHNGLEETINYNELSARINKLVDDLPVAQKEIYLLSKVQGLKNDEIANRLNLSKRTVEHQLYRALVKLKKSVSPYAYEVALFLAILFIL